ncbi:hypothetical protein ACH495_29650 [Micromonospora sp. NPDC018662]|uniref:hypothetical protein n=1 Tax=Micromonospora sp. NPDC018662 TaxID=3364238 RepID=UPI0037944BF7
MHHHIDAVIGSGKHVEAPRGRTAGDDCPQPRTGPTDSRFWRGSATGGWPAATAAATIPVLLAAAAGCLLLAGRADLPTALAWSAAATLWTIAAVAATLSALATCRLTVEITTYQVAVRHPLLPGPNAAVPLHQVRAVWAVDVPARPWTIWWFPSPGTWHRTALIRSGAAVRLELTSGRSFVASVDDPESAVAALRRQR